MTKCPKVVCLILFNFGLDVIIHMCRMQALQMKYINCIIPTILYISELSVQKDCFEKIKVAMSH